MMDDPTLPNLSKPALRKQALARRNNLAIDRISSGICERLAEWPVFRQAEQVLFYHAFRNEVDLWPLYHQTPHKAWFLPAMLPTHDLVFRRADKDLLVEDGRYGIHEPHAEAPEWQPGDGRTLLLVPGLLFDVQGYRLGYGKGYYDRFLSQFQSDAGSIPKVGIVPKALIHEQLPHDDWDIPMDFLASEQGVSPVSPTNQPV